MNEALRLGNPSLMGGLERLTEQVCVLDKELSDLEARLQPLLLPNAPGLRQEPPVPAPQPMSEALQRLYGLHTRIRGLTDRMVTLRTEVQL